MPFLDELCYKNILKRINEFSILKYYWPEFDGPGQYYSNIRDDDNSSKSLSVIHKNNKFILSDFGTAYVGIGVPTYLQLRLGVPLTNQGYQSVLSHIVKSFNLPITPYTEAISIHYNSTATVYNKEFENTKKTGVTYKKRPWGSLPIDEYYWGRKHHIDFKDIIPILLKFDVYPVERWWVNYGTTNITELYNPAYVYELGPFSKLYKPLERIKSKKWLNTIPKDAVLGLHTLPKKGDLLLVEKSMKDVIFASYLGYNTIPLNSESTFLPEDVFKDLKKRFKTIIFHLDNDSGGLRNIIRFQRKYGGNCIANPLFMPKDNSEIVSRYGITTLKKLLQTLIY